MAAHTKVGVGYNIQIAVDAKNKMIVEAESDQSVVDMRLLTEPPSPPAPSSIRLSELRHHGFSEIRACEKRDDTRCPTRQSSMERPLSQDELATMRLIYLSRTFSRIESTAESQKFVRPNWKSNPASYCETEATNPAFSLAEPQCCEVRPRWLARRERTPRWHISTEMTPQAWYKGDVSRKAIAAWRRDGGRISIDRGRDHFGGGPSFGSAAIIASIRTL